MRRLFFRRNGKFAQSFNGCQKERETCAHVVQERKFIRTFKSSDAEFKGNSPATCSDIHAKQTKKRKTHRQQLDKQMKMQMNEWIKICYLYSCRLILFSLSFSRNFRSFVRHSREILFHTHRIFALDQIHCKFAEIPNGAKKYYFISLLRFASSLTLDSIHIIDIGIVTLHSCTNNWNALTDWFSVWLSFFMKPLQTSIWIRINLRLMADESKGQRDKAKKRNRVCKSGNE